MAIKKIPLRKCVITGEQHPKQEMFRVVRMQDNTVVVDPTGKVRGHGAYVVKDKKAILNAQKKKSLDRHLEVHVDDQIYEELLSLISEDKKI